MGGLSPHYLRLLPGESLPDISAYAPFKAVVILAADYSDEWQDEVSKWLVHSRCRYTMAWGPNCSSWDDSVDWVTIEENPGETPPDKFVMTTWHENESLEFTFWYAQFCANFSYDDVELKETVLLDISSVSREGQMIALWAQSKTLAEREVDET